MAVVAIEILIRTEQAKARLQERLDGASYICPIPPVVNPVTSQ